MNNFWHLREKTTTILFERRWLLLLLLAAFTLLFELWENLNGQERIDSHLIREVLFFCVVYPLVTFLLINRLLAVQAERNHIASQQERSRQLKEKLMQSRTMNEVYQTIVSFPESIAPVLGVVLFRPTSDWATLEMVSERWPIHAIRPFQLPATIQNEFCGAAAHLPDHHLHPFVSPHLAENASLHGYCLPLFRGEQVTGLLHLYLPATKNLTADQIGILNQTTAAIALALGTAVSSNVEVIQATAVNHERKRIARHLHDTLGPSLAYLQLRLTKLTTEDFIFNSSAIQQDLARMRDVSNEAYEQVRQTMLTIQVDNDQNLSEALIHQAKTMAEHADLKLNCMTSGYPHSLPPLVQRKILFIFREALNNVWKHAQATAVDLCITWKLDSLTINLNDNGCGFNNQNISQNGHFGLLIMAQRAEEIKADLSITAAPGKGTHVRLHYPLP